MIEVLLLIAGASIALFSTWVKSWMDRETHCSNEMFKQRISCMNQIWSSFYEVKNIYGANIVILEHAKWVEKYGKEADEKLNAYRRLIDESQIVLSEEIVSGFRELDTYLSVLISENGIRVSQYVAELNEILARLSKVINEAMDKRVHKVDLQLST